MDIEPLEFEDHLKVFLTLPHIQRLREYGKFMETRNQRLITGYRESVATDNKTRLSRLRKELIRRQLQ